MLGFGIRESTTTTGTGNLTVSSETGYPTFNNVFGTNRPFNYSILDSAGLPIEHGIGYLSASTTLVRTKVLATYVSSTYTNIAPSAASLASGTKYVIGTSGPGGYAAPYIFNAAESYAKPANFQYWRALQTYIGAANRTHAYPVFFNWQPSITTGYIEVTTAEASKNLRWGIWDINVTTGRPGKLLLDSGEISLASTGVKSFSVGLHLSGWKWVGWTHNASTALLRAMHYDYLNCGPLMGWSISSGATSAYASVTYGALSDNPSTTSLFNDHMPAFAWV